MAINESTMMGENQVKDIFLNHFYGTLNSSPKSLSGIYLDKSALRLQGELYNGPEAIIQKYQVLNQLSEQQTESISTNNLIKGAWSSAT